MDKISKFLLTFILLNFVIAVVWYIIELVTLKQIQESSEDTVICIILSLLLTIIINNNKVQGFLNKGK